MSASPASTLAIACLGCLTFAPLLNSQRFATRIFWLLVQIASAAFVLSYIPNDSAYLETCLYFCTSVITIAFLSAYLVFTQRNPLVPLPTGKPLSCRAAWTLKAIVALADSRKICDATKGIRKCDQAEKPTSSLSQHRTRFLLSRLAMMAGIIAVRHMDIQSLLSPFGNTVALPFDLGFLDLAPRTKRSLLRRIWNVTAREVSIRAWLVVFHNLYGVSAMVVPHCILSIVFVCVLRVSEPEEWPHLFGSPAEAYSVRRYWSKFWHQAPVPTYVRYAKLFGDKMLPFRRGEQLYRLWVVFFVFACSALMHAGTLFILGFRCGWWEQIYWWALNFAAIVVETVVFSAVRSIIGERLGRGPSWALRALGHAWVFAFQFWSLPKMYFPTAVFCFPLSGRQAS